MEAIDSEHPLRAEPSVSEIVSIMCSSGIWLRDLLTAVAGNGVKLAKW